MGIEGDNKLEEFSMSIFFCAVIVLVSFWYGTEDGRGFAASVSPKILKAKQEADAKGYIFITSKDEIIAKAKEEAKLQVLTFLERDAKKAMTEAFKKKYPFIQEIVAEEIGGTEEYQRFILEMKAGRAQRWDTVHISNQVYSEYPPYLKKFDILGMAEQGVLNIPARIVDPNNRTIVSKGTQVAVAAYNKKLIAAEKVPTTWEGFLAPEFKGRKFVVDVRPLSVANLVPAWGLEKTLDFARKIADQRPVWVRGSRTLASMALGEYSLFMGLNLSSVLEARAKDLTKSLEVQFLDPVPVRPGGRGRVDAALVADPAGSALLANGVLLLYLSGAARQRHLRRLLQRQRGRQHARGSHPARVPGTGRARRGGPVVV